jgi:tetratricopeptide (TPR) repeat protein
MTKCVLLLLACAACASAPVATESTPVSSVSEPMLMGAAQWADSARRVIDKATIAGDLDELRESRLLLEKALGAYPNDALLLHYEGYELYREAGVRQGLGGADARDVPLIHATARTKLQQSLAAQPIPETHALLAMVMGSLIGEDRSSAPMLGPMIPLEMNAAVTMAPTNPRVWLLRGIQSFYTPTQYGGGLSVAETQLNRAIELFATDNPAPPLPRWGRAEAYVWLGQVLQKNGRTAEARTAYNRALALQPNYPWVIYSLLPSLR